MTVMTSHPRFGGLVPTTCALVLLAAGCSSESSTTPTPEPSPLISAATVKGWVDGGAVNGSGAGRVVVLDVASTTYAAGHIPGAQLLSSASLYQNRKEGPAVDINMVPDGARMDALVQALGIDGDTTIVFTSSSILQATRAYWTFRYWGFPKSRLKLIDGLNAAWDADYDLTTVTPTVTPSTYGVGSNATLRDDLRASLPEMMAVASGGVANAVVLDARTSYLTDGVFPPSAGGDYTVFEGHIKGAKLLTYTSLYEAATGKFKTPDALRTALGGVGIDGTKTTYAHCRTGVIAAVPFFVLDAILGWPVVNYDASWSQWGQLSADAANGGQLAADSPWQTDLATLSEGVTYNHATRNVELLALDGAACTGTMDPAGVSTFSPADCTFVPPESGAASGNQVEEEDLAYMASH